MSQETKETHNSILAEIEGEIHEEQAHDYLAELNEFLSQASKDLDQRSSKKPAPMPTENQVIQAVSKYLKDSNLAKIVADYAVIGTKTWFNQQYKAGRRDFSEVSFEEEISFYKENLLYVKFSGADLPKATFEDCDLTGTNFSNANLTEAHFITTRDDPESRIIHFQRTLFFQANLKNATFEGCTGTPNFTEANQENSKFTDCRFHGERVSRQPMYGTRWEDQIDSGIDEGEEGGLSEEEGDDLEETEDMPVTLWTLPQSESKVTFFAAPVRKERADSGNTTAEELDAQEGDDAEGDSDYDPSLELEDNSSSLDNTRGPR